MRCPQIVAVMFADRVLAPNTGIDFGVRYGLPDILSIAVAGLALIVSGATAWLTLFRRGSVRMTRPTVVFFGPDGGSGADGVPRPKVFLRSLLYCTAQRGRIVESMYITLRRGESSQTFSIWVYGDGPLSRGSGLYVGHNGVVCNHHFLLPADGTSFQFLAGDYVLQVHATLVGGRAPILLSEVRLILPEHLSLRLEDGHSGAYFDWGPDSGNYHVHVESRPELNLSPARLSRPRSSEMEAREAR